MNLNDFSKTNYEWAFLDDIKLSKILTPNTNFSFFNKLYIKLCPIKDFRKTLRRTYHV